MDAGATETTHETGHINIKPADKIQNVTFHRKWSTFQNVKVQVQNVPEL